MCCDGVIEYGSNDRAEGEGERVDWVMPLWLQASSSEAPTCEVLMFKVWGLMLWWLWTLSSHLNNPILETWEKKPKKYLWPLFMDGVQLPQG